MQDRRSAILLLSLLTLACSSTTTEGNSGAQPGKKSKEIVCPSIAKIPTAVIDLGDGAMTRNGSYAVEFEADGQRETCEFEISGISPQTTACEGEECVVQSPSTRTTTTCKLVDVAGIQGDGSIKFVATAGTPKRITISLSRDGNTLVSGSAEPDYTPDECGFIEPQVTLSKS